MMHKSINFLSYLMPLILFDCIETANAFPQGFGHKEKGANYRLNYTTNGGRKALLSKRRKSPFLNHYKEKDTQEYLGVSLDPMQNDSWGILSNSPSKERKLRRKHGELSPDQVSISDTISEDVDADLSTENATSIRQGLTYFLQITCARFIDKLQVAGESDTITMDNDTFVKLRSREQEQMVTLVDINWLKTHEEVLIDRVANLKDAIQEWEEYRMPLLVDSKSGAILDGHHRYHVGRMLGLSRLPVVLVDYLEDDTIDVDVWPECGLDCLSKEDVIQMSLSDEVYPPKTSKHGFVADMEPINIPLWKLE